MTYVSSPIKLYAAGVAIALLGAFAVSANAAPGGPGMMDHGPMMMGQGPMGGPMAGGPMMGGMLPRMLDRVNATPEQRAQIKQIVDNNASERRAQFEAGRALRDQALALFAQPALDEKAAEALLQKQLALHETTSKRMLAAMLDISRVLTPEQRKQMAEQMTQRREMMQRHFRERQAIDAPKS